MAKYVAKLSKFGGQFRVTIPKGLIDEAGWQDVELVILNLLTDGQIKMWRFVDGESLKSEATIRKIGSDR